MGTTEMSINLQIDTNTNRVVFAEASKDFVDFLFYLLYLPMGTVNKFLTSESTMGSIGNLHTSFENLDKTYMQPKVDRNVLINPMLFPTVTNIPLPISKSSSQKFYTCKKCKIFKCFTNIHNGAICRGCFQSMGTEINFIAASEDNDTKGFVKDAVSYMVSDDLSVTPMSMTSVHSMMNKFNVSKLEERKVKIGDEEALELLKIFFRSTTVLTDVFLERTNRGEDVEVTVKGSKPFEARKKAKLESNHD